MNAIQKSEAIKTGLRKGFQDGSSKMARRKCYGYTLSPNGELEINPDEATVVRWIFERYLSGGSLGRIAAGLEKQGILSPTGRPKWNREAIDKLLSNEKYTGRVMLQKTISTGAVQIENNGLMDRYLYAEPMRPLFLMRYLKLFKKKSKKGAIFWEIGLPLGLDSDKIKIKKLVAEGVALQKLTKMPDFIDRCPAAMKRFRVAAYCRVSTRQEEQNSSIEQQEQYYTQVISNNPNWTNVGVFSKRVSGLRMKGRSEFQALMRLCRRGKVDLILIKSFSRLGRNTLDMLQALRELRDLGVDVYFEEKNLWLHDERMEMLITVFCAFAQSESENMSQNIRWGVRQGFRMVTSGYANFVCYGYKRGDDGRLTIDEPDAEIVRRIFQMRAEGKSLGAISDWLYENKKPSPAGKERWSRETINKLLRNEKYTGDVLLQKTFVKNVLTGKQFKNRGELERYLIQQHHPMIVSRELFERVNLD